MKPSTLQKEYIRAYRQFNNLGRSLEAIRKENVQAGIERLFAALAHRAIIADIENRYLPRLYEIEQGYYDADERLIEERLPPDGIMADGVILPPAEETPYDPSLQQNLDVATLSGDNGPHDNGPHDNGPHAHLPLNDMIDVDAVQGMVRNHTIHMALRKCYGNTFP
jgi:hypothetical protein